MRTVNQVSKLTGVSVRTLHHYDAIGLLHPTSITGAGYRLYDDAALARLHTILLFRELEFPLKQIASILDNPSFDPVSALDDQIRLLQMRRDQLDSLILQAKEIQRTGVISMNFSTFDRSKQAQYAAEAKRRWGSTDAYREYEQKTAGQTENQQASAAEGLMAIFARMGQIRHLSPAGEEAQALVKELQDYITANYYNCTKPILRGLGMMYIAGDEMTENIDKAGGEGTARFAHDAIQIYCK